MEVTTETLMWELTTETRMVIETLEVTTEVSTEMVKSRYHCTLAPPSYL